MKLTIRANGEQKVIIWDNLFASALWSAVDIQHGNTNEQL